jgi:hypothetical protein
MMTHMPIMPPPVMRRHMMADHRPAYSADHRPGRPGDDKAAGGPDRGPVDGPIGERRPSSAKGDKPSHA